MANLLYFLADHQDITIAELPGLELDRVFGEDDPVRRGIASGPDGRGGVVFHTQMPAGRHWPSLSYQPEDQHWAPCATCADLWIGHWMNNPPTPDDLARPQLVDGYLITLSDTNQWIIPIARVFPEGSSLPESLVLGPDGALVRKTLPQYVQFSARAGQYLHVHEDAMASPQDVVELKPEQWWDLATAALSINYKLGPEEISYLGLLDTVNIWVVLGATIDYPRRLPEWQKLQAEVADQKKAGTGGQPSPAEPPDSGASATGPPTPR